MRVMDSWRFRLEPVNTRLSRYDSDEKFIPILENCPHKEYQETSGYLMVILSMVLLLNLDSTHIARPAGGP